MRYPLGDLNFVVQFEVDACYKERSEDTAEEATHQTVHTADAESLALMTDELFMRLCKEQRRTELSVLPNWLPVRDGLREWLVPHAGVLQYV